MKKIFAILLASLALTFVGCNDGEVEETNTDNTTKQEETQKDDVTEEVAPEKNPDDIDEEIAMSILKGEVVFKDFDTDELATLYTLGYNGAPYRYALVDLDADGARELVVEHDVAGDTAIIDINRGFYTAYYVSYRGITGLKNDGTMSWSNSAFESGVRRIEFSNDGIIDRDIILYNSEKELFLVDGKYVTEDECATAFGLQSEKEDVEWIEIPAEYKPDFVKEFCEKAKGIWTQGTGDVRDFVSFQNTSMHMGVIQGHSWWIGDVVEAAKLSVEPIYAIAVYSPEYYDEMDGYSEESTSYYVVSFYDGKIKLDLYDEYGNYYSSSEYEYYAAEF